MQQTPNYRNMVLTATRFNFAKYQLQGTSQFLVQFVKGDYTDPSLNIDPDLRFMVVDFPLPSESTEQIPINYFNQTIYLAGKTSFETTQFQLRDAMVYDTEMKFLDWRKKVYDPETGMRGLASEYKMDAIVFEFSSNGKYYRAWKCVGCFPAAVNYGTMSNENDGYKNISVTLRYDYAYRYDAGIPDLSESTYEDFRIGDIGSGNF